MLPNWTRSCRRNILLVLLVVVVYCSYSWLYGKTPIEYHHAVFPTQFYCRHNAQVKKTATNREATERKKLILFYTTVFERVTVFHAEKLQCCGPFRCDITADKSRILESDAVIFHGRDLQFTRMPAQRTPSQRWVFFSMESPFNSKITAKNYNGLFNWTMTYERRADLYMPYGYFAKKNVDSGSLSRDYTGGKDKLVVYMNSNCKTQDGVRETYIRALNKVLKVDVYGKCGGIFGRRMCPRTGNKCPKLLKRYKFYISFENGICEDYITEKYWSVPFRYDLVPIVFGLDYFKALAIPDSYINAADFSSVRSLANHLKYLDKNDTAYNEYFQWRKFYQTANLEPWPCRLCRMLHNESLPIKTYTNFDNFLDPKFVCNIRDHPEFHEIVF